MINKRFKICLSLLLSFCLVISMSVPTFAESGAESLTIYQNPYGGGQTDIDTIEWHKMSEGNYYFFLPADFEESNVCVYSSTGQAMIIDGFTVENGGHTDKLSKNGSHTVICGNMEYTVNVMRSENIPSMYIDTESGSLDYIHKYKENKEAGSIRIYSDEGIILDKELKQIKGRGNATWTDYEKKPYNIKFDKKTELLGMTKAKKWTLLASACDPSIVRNPTAWEVAKRLGIDFTSDYRIVDLYINGYYMGNYIICESVEIGENRVDIFDLNKATEDVNSEELENYGVGGTGIFGSVPPWGTFPSAKWVNIPNNPDDITGGYLLECEFSDRYTSEISGFVTSRNQNVVIKEPEYATKSQVNYISKYWQEAEDAIWAESGFNSSGKHYSEYFDFDSLVNMYILFEFSGNGDGGKTSTFFYKDKGGKLVAAPAWDFDHGFDSAPDQWTTNLNSYNEQTANIASGELPTIFNVLYSHKDFRDAVKARWKEVEENIAGRDMINFIETLAGEIETSAVMNAVRWGNFSTKDEYINRVSVAKNYISEKRKWLYIGFGDNAANIMYNLNGGTGSYEDKKIYVNGNTTIAMNPLDVGENDRIAIPPSIGLAFKCWNTKADGTGDSYYPGDTIVLNGYMVLYAQWRDVLRINKRFGAAFDYLLSRITPWFNVIADYCIRLDKKYSIMKVFENLIEEYTKVLNV